MNFINIYTNEYPLSEQQVRDANPQFSFSRPFAGNEQYRGVVSVTKPSVNNLTHFVREINPVLGPNSEFLQQWETVEYDQPTKDALLANKNASRWEAIKSVRDNKLQTGGYLVGTKWFHSDTFSRTQQTALVVMGAGIPVGLQWKTMDGTFVTMTQTLAADIFAAGAASDTALFAHAEALKADPDADIYAGWPAVFEG